MNVEQPWSSGVSDIYDYCKLGLALERHAVDAKTARGIGTRSPKLNLRVASESTSANDQFTPRCFASDPSRLDAVDSQWVGGDLLRTATTGDPHDNQGRARTKNHGGCLLRGKVDP